MNSNFVRFGMAAVVVVLAVILGINFLSSPNVGNPEPVATPTATPTSTPIPLPTTDQDLEAGTYVSHPFYSEPEPYSSIEFTFELPDGWRVFEGGAILTPVGAGFAPPDGIAILTAVPHGLFSDPCNADYSPGNTDVTTGTTAEDLANAFAAQTAYDSTAPTDVTLGRYSGKEMDLLMPTDVAFSSCNEGGFFIWDGSIYAQGPGNVWHLWILDVEDERIVIFIQDFPGTPEALQAEARDIVESIQIQP